METRHPSQYPGHRQRPPPRERDQGPRGQVHVHSQERTRICLQVRHYHCQLLVVIANYSSLGH